MINVVDASNPARNPYLTTQLIEMDANLIIAFNMSDILQKEGIKIDMALLRSLAPHCNVAVKILAQLSFWKLSLNQSGKRTIRKKYASATVMSLKMR